MNLAALFALALLNPASQPSPQAASPTAAVTPVNGHIIVSTRGDSALVLIDPVSFRAYGRLEAPVGLHEIAASPDGRRAIGSAYGSGPRHQTPDQRLLVINLPDNNPATDDAMTLGALIDLGTANVRPNDLAFFPDNRHVLCTSEVAQTVLKIDVDAAGEGGQDAAPDYEATPSGPTAPPPAAAGTAPVPIVETYSFGARAGHMLAVSRDFTRCYVPSVADQTVSVIDLTTGEVLAAPIAGQGAEGIAAAPDNSAVWIACNRGESIAILDPATNTIAHTFASAGFPLRLRFTPDSAFVVVSYPVANQVRVFDAATRELVKTFGFPPDSAPTSIAVSPDGRLLAVVCAGIEAVAILDLRTGQILSHNSVGPVPDGLAWAPAQ